MTFDVCLPPSAHHGIVLHLGTSIKLECQPYPVAGPKVYQIVRRLEAFLDEVELKRLLPARCLPPILPTSSGERQGHGEEI